MRWVLCLLVLATGCGRGGDPPIEPAEPYILAGRLVTMTGEAAVIADGALLIEDGRIAALWDRRQGPPSELKLEGVEIIETGGLVFPGLIDLHNHPHYNVTPLRVPDERYQNRGQWQSLESNRTESVWPVRILTRDHLAGLFEEVMVYAEVKALVGGTTTIQGTPSRYGGDFTRVLVRNIEHSPLSGGRIRNRVRSVWDLKGGWIYKIWMRVRRLDAYFIHLAEGVDEWSRNDFETLKEKGLLVESLVVIHGTALEAEDFAEMGEVGAKLVWSPLSNLLLYGGTTDVRAAVDAGVLVSLGPDWSRSGSKNLLGEFKVADGWNRRAISPPFTDYELVKMATVNPARTLGWDDRLGSLRQDLLADLMVVRDPGGDPYRALIEAGDEDLLLVTVGGDARYGLPEWMERLKPGDHEIIACGDLRRGLDITQGGVDWEGRSFAEIESLLAEAMQFEGWRDSTEFKGLEPVPLSPLFMDCDPEHQAALEDLFSQ